MKATLNALTEEIIGAAISVHRELGPGMLESAYEACLAFELLNRHMRIERQKPLPLVYRDQRLDCGFRVDLIVNALMIVEVKAIERFEPVHQAQLLSYLRLAKCTVGLLINFNVKWLAGGGINQLSMNFQTNSAGAPREIRVDRCAGPDSVVFSACSASSALTVV